jgi:predicted amidohydrolase
MKEQLVVGIVQPTLRPPTESPLEATSRVSRMMRDAAARNQQSASSRPSSPTCSSIDIFVLPEICPIGYSEDTFARFLPSTLEIQELYHQIGEEMKCTAQACQCYVCYGSIGWKHTSDDKSLEYFIRQKVVSSEGILVASYDKIYLCDYGDCNETRLFTPGNQVCTFECQGWKLGLLICADIRYPRLSQEIVLHGYCHDREETTNIPPSSILNTCQVILQPACFSRDLSFRTWKSFRETRAIENSVFWIGSNYSGSSYGESSVTPPWVDDDHEPIVYDTQSGVYKVALDKCAVEWARTEMSYYRYLIHDRSYSKS